MQQFFLKVSSPEQLPFIPYFAFFSFKLLILLMLMTCFLLGSVDLFADTSSTYRQIELRHRSAFSLQQTLAPLTDGDVVILAEGNSLILKGPAAGLNNLVSIIKKLDKPRQQLQVSIYRGIDPSILNINDKVKDQRWSTNTGKQNRVDIVNIEEGSLLIINDSELISVPVEEAQQIGKTIAPLSQYSQQHSHQQTQLQTQQQESIAFESSYKREDILTVEKGVKLVATLVKDSKGKSRIALKTTYALPSEDSGDTSNASNRILNRETTLTTRIDIGQWQLLSSNQTLSHRPAINTSTSRTKVSSTQKKGESEYKVWVKFGLL